VGDAKTNKIGVGVAKGADVTAAVSKASDIAKKNFVKIAVVNSTIPHEVDGRVGGARIMVKPAAPGTGLIAGGVVRTILEVVGISNALSKSLGSSNKINIAYATIEALQTSLPKEKWLNYVAKTYTKTAAKSPNTEKPEPKTEPKTEPKAEPKKPAAKKPVAKDKK
nr:30S ribosomal protein S5 [bacterium]